MASAVNKEYSSTSNYPRSLSSIIISVGLLAGFITLASWILLSYPIGTVVRSYFYGVENTSDLDLPINLEGPRSGEVHDAGKTNMVNVKEFPSSEGATTEHAANEDNGDTDTHKSNVSISSGNDTVATESNSREQGNEVPESPQSGDSMGDGSNVTVSAGVPKPETSSDNSSSEAPVESECDLYHGQWFYDPAGPVYTNNSCPVITQMQNCQGNGRPDKEYESWRWKPAQCELPRFNGTKFLELMRGKTLAFVGDSVARNQMESLLCLLWQVEAPKNRGNRHMQRWYFRSKDVMIVRIWSSWLVHQMSEPFSYVPDGVAKLLLDVPDDNFMQYIPKFDVVVLSSGHWFAKQSVYMLNNEIVGTQLWSPPKQHQQEMKINSVEAYGISVDTCLTAMVTHPNYTGLTIVRAYSPDHYEGGAWNTGGSCTGKQKPLMPGQLVENGFTNTMHGKQVDGFYRAIKKQTNRSKLKLMDITEAFSYRHDGHPGPYRNPDPNKITKRGPDGRPPPQDCLHWCMPGPVDTWNELMLEIIRREFEGKKNSAL